MGFEPAVQMWTLHRYEAERGGGGGQGGLGKWAKGRKGGHLANGLPHKSGEGEEGGLMKFFCQFKVGPSVHN
jgi:hypothetical protein